MQSPLNDLILFRYAAPWRVCDAQEKYAIGAIEAILPVNASTFVPR